MAQAAVNRVLIMKISRHKQKKWVSRCNNCDSPWRSQFNSEHTAKNQGRDRREKDRKKAERKKAKEESTTSEIVLA